MSHTSNSPGRASHLNLPRLNAEEPMRALINSLCPGLKYELKCTDSFDPHSVVATATFADGETLLQRLFADDGVGLSDYNPQEYKELMGEMKKLVRIHEENATVPLWVFMLFHFMQHCSAIAARCKEMLSSTENCDQLEDELFNEIANHYGVSTKHITSIMLLPQFCFKRLNMYVSSKQEHFKHVSLVDLLRNSDLKMRLLEACSGQGLIDKKKYTGGVWEEPDSLPSCWLNYGIVLERGKQEVLKHLYKTASIGAVMGHTNFTQPLILSGESGGGKTCALLAAGGSHDVNIAAAADDVVQEYTIVEDKAQNIQNMVEHIDNYVTYILRNALVETNNNKETKALNVMLHLDEVSDYMHEKARFLIHAAAALHAAHRVQVRNGSILLSISIAMAGTGLSSLLNCAPGSLAGKFKLIAVEPPAADELREIVALHLGRHDDNKVKVVMAQREFRDVVATNMRLLSFSLRTLATVLGSPENVVSSNQSSDIDLKCVIPPPASTCDSVVHALRYACSVGVVHFVNANGLSTVSAELRRALLHLAHRAYLDRVVFIEDDAFRDPLVAAGFTPILRDGSVRFMALQQAERLGIFTTTEEERKLPLESGWLQTTAAAQGVAMAVRAGCLPLRMSAAYRMLPRLLSGTLFSKGTPLDFEELMTELCCEGLVASDGTCPRSTLLAAVCGPEYAMRYASGALGVPAAQDTSAPPTSTNHDSTGTNNASTNNRTTTAAAAAAQVTQSQEEAVATVLRNMLIGEAHTEALVAKLQSVVEGHRSGRRGADGDSDRAAGTHRGAHKRPREEDDASETDGTPELTTASVPSSLSYTHVVKVVLGFKLQPHEDCSMDVAVACARALQEQHPDTARAKQLALVEELLAAESADEEVGAFVRRALRRFLINKVFVLVPAEKSPSADTVIMCVSDTTPYLAGVQDKRYIARPVADSIFKKEVKKMSQKCKSMKSLMNLSGAKSVECFFGLYQEQTYMPTGRIAGQIVHTFVRNEIVFFKLTCDEKDVVKK